MLRLSLQHNFYNIIFKITNKLAIASVSAPPPPSETLGAHLYIIISLLLITEEKSVYCAARNYFLNIIQVNIVVKMFMRKYIHINNDS
jgi:hypothetical protein